MDNIIVGEGLPFAVFEPFLCGLVAPYVGFPRFEGYICEILGIVNIYVAFVFLPSIYPFYFGNGVVTCYGEGGDEGL